MVDFVVLGYLLLPVTVSCSMLLLC